MARRRILPLALLFATLTACSGGAGSAIPPTTTRPAPSIEDLGPTALALYEDLEAAGSEDTIGLAGSRCLAQLAVQRLGDTAAVALFDQLAEGGTRVSSDDERQMAEMITECAGVPAVVELLAVARDGAQVNRVTHEENVCVMGRFVDQIGPGAAAGSIRLHPMPRPHAIALLDAYSTCKVFRQMSIGFVALAATEEQAECIVEVTDREVMRDYLVALLAGDARDREEPLRWLARSHERCVGTEPTLR